jgi:micrococcal nuclease
MSNLYKYKCRIVRIIDGDTVVADVDLGFEVELKGQKIRLYGINTPESRTRNKEEKVRGLAAKARLVELLDTGEFYLESHDKGKYGRILGVLYQTDDFSLCSINQVLVNENHAVEYFGGKR